VEVIAYSLIIITITASIIIATARTIIVAPATIIIGRSAAVDKYWVIAVIIASRGPINVYVQRWAHSRRRTNKHFALGGVDTPAQRSKIRHGDTCQQD
jgi:hypothetical protein